MIDNDTLAEARERMKAFETPPADPEPDPVEDAPEPSETPESPTPLDPDPIAAVSIPTLERRPPAGMTAVDYNTGGRRMGGPQEPELPELEAPAQAVNELAPDAVFGTYAGRARAEGWVVPLPALDEVLRMREGLRLGLLRAGRMRAADTTVINRAVTGASDLTVADPPAAVVDALIAVGLDMVLQVSGSQDSVVNSLSQQLETRWLALIYQHRRAVIRSLEGRDSASSNRLRALAESMEGLVQPPTPRKTDWLIYP